LCFFLSCFLQPRNEITPIGDHPAVALTIKKLKLEGINIS